MMKIFFLFFTVVFSGLTFGQHPLMHPADAVEIRFGNSQPVIHYILEVDSADLSGYNVEMRIRNAPDTYRVAMMVHPEYDDRFLRYVKGIEVEVGNGLGVVIREDSSLWRIVAKGGESVLRYRIMLPPAESQRAAWRPFLSPSGGLVGGLQSFMYIVGSTLAPSHITLKLPRSWLAATGLEPTADPGNFYAPSAGVLFDSPILVGIFRTWLFTVDGVPHRVIYWPLPSATEFDTAMLVNNIRRLVEQAAKLFGRLPYRDYSFILQDGSFGALEHSNSVTLGAPSSMLAKGSTELLAEIAHEYFHTWNIMRIRPAEYGDVSYLPTKLSRGLWWSEGLTIFYADLFLRRAGLPVSDSTRIGHLAEVIRRYHSNPAYSRISAERISQAAYAPPGFLGDYNASTHLQGEMIGTMLDLIIRDATGGRRSIDDVMRKMLENYSGLRGFTGRDIERVVSQVCGCNVHRFFEDHVRGIKPVDFEKYLSLIGMYSNISWIPVSGPDGQPVPDFRVYSFQLPGNDTLLLGITDPQSCWGKAGLHTGDRVMGINGSPVANASDFRVIIRRLHIGDTVTLKVGRTSGLKEISVVVTGYKRALVRLEEIPNATERQLKLREQWISGKG